MPCSDDGPDYSEDRLNLVTRVACELLKELRRVSPVGTLLVSEEASQWIAAHDEMDAARIKAEEEEQQAEKLKATALKKLTKAERRALGL